jgi:hypothetical protein
MDAPPSMQTGQELAGAAGRCRACAGDAAVARAVESRTGVEVIGQKDEEQEGGKKAAWRERGREGGKVMRGYDG